MATYDKNDRVRLTATFTSDGAAAAATVVCTHRKPSGGDTTVTTSGGGTGISRMSRWIRSEHTPSGSQAQVPS